MRSFCDSLTSTGGDSPCTGPPVNVPIQRTAHLFGVIPANDTKESMFGHQNASSPVAGIKPNILALFLLLYAKRTLVFRKRTSGCELILIYGNCFIFINLKDV